MMRRSIPAHSLLTQTEQALGRIIKATCGSISQAAFMMRRELEMIPATRSQNAGPPVALTAQPEQMYFSNPLRD